MRRDGIGVGAADDDDWQEGRSVKEDFHFIRSFLELLTH